MDRERRSIHYPAGWALAGGPQYDHTRREPETHRRLSSRDTAGNLRRKVERNLRDKRRFPDSLLRPDRPRIPEIVRRKARLPPSPLQTSARVLVSYFPLVFVIHPS